MFQFEIQLVKGTFMLRVINYNDYEHKSYKSILADSYLSQTVQVD